MGTRAEVGAAVSKDANLTVLMQSPYEVAPEQLKDIEVWGTMLEGRMQPVAPVPVAKSTDRGSADVAAEQDGEVQGAVAGQLANLVGHHSGE